MEQPPSCHSIFDALSVVSLEGSGDLTVQQLLDSPIIQSTVTVEDEVEAPEVESGDNIDANCISLASTDIVLPIDDNDVFQCGRCKSQFTSLVTFVVHKRSNCSGKSAHISHNEVATSIACDELLDAVPVSIGTEVTHIDSSQSRVNGYSCDLPSTGVTNQSVGNEGEYFNLTFNGRQVFTLGGNLHLTAAEEENKEGLMNLNVPSSILESGTACSLNIGSEGLENTVLTKAEVSPVTDCNEIADASMKTQFFHGGMTKNIPPRSESPKAKCKQRCPYCEKEFSKNFDLQQHIRSHTGVKPFQCVVCGRPFAQKSNVKKHMATHKVWPMNLTGRTLPPKHFIKKGSPVKQENRDPAVTGSEDQGEVLVDNSYVCPFCNLTVDTYLRLRTHMKKHNDQKVYRCIQKKCEETYGDLDIFLEHIKTHEKDAQYKCHHCTKAFASLRTLAYHQFEHCMYPRSKKTSGATPRYYRCTKCLNKYSSPEALEHHQKTSSHHYPCQQCCKIFYSERLLRRHLRVHGQAVPSKCPTCSKEFKSEYSLKIHLLTHTGERPYECQLCSNAFNRKDKLKRHLLIHEEKKLKCPFRNSHGCLREFRRADKLRLHVVSHALPTKKTKTKHTETSLSNKEPELPEVGVSAPRKIVQRTPLIKEEELEEVWDDKISNGILTRSKSRHTQPNKNIICARNSKTNIVCKKYVCKTEHKYGEPKNVKNEEESALFYFKNSDKYTLEKGVDESNASNPLKIEFSNNKSDNSNMVEVVYIPLSISDNDISIQDNDIIIRDTDLNVPDDETDHINLNVQDNDIIIRDTDLNVPDNDLQIRDVQDNITIQDNDIIIRDTDLNIRVDCPSELEAESIIYVGNEPVIDGLSILYVDNETGDLYPSTV